jgi:hypothetical protein
MNGNEVKKLSTSFSKLTHNLKKSCKLVLNNLPSYFMAGLGMMLFIVVIIVVPILLLLATSITYPAIGSLFSKFILWALTSPVYSLVFVVILIFPVSVFLFVIVGSLQAMAHQVLQEGETQAETSHSHLWHKFFSLPGAGAILTILIVIPNLIAWGLAWYHLDAQVYGNAAIFLPIFSFLWTLLTFGLTSLTYPAIIHGKGVQEAVKESFRIAIRHFDQVFGFLVIIIIPFTVLEGPLLYFAMLNDWSLDVFSEITSFDSIYLSGWWVFSIFFWFVILLPIMQIFYMNIYLEYIGESVDSSDLMEIMM